MIVASGIAMQFGAKPLFENVSVKFGGGNRYGLIGANGSGKSTFMKILGGDWSRRAGTVAIDADERLGKLRQDQFAYENERVLDVVLMGHAEMWARDARARRDLRQPGGGRRGVPARGGAGSEVRRVRRLHRRGARGRAAARPGRADRAARRPDERGGAGLEAARAARAGALRRTRTSCCWTSRPTTSTSTASAGSRTC